MRAMELLFHKSWSSSRKGPGCQGETAPRGEDRDERALAWTADVDYRGTEKSCFRNQTRKPSLRPFVPCPCTLVIDAR